MAATKAWDNQIKGDSYIQALNYPQKRKMGKNINHFYAPYLILLILGPVDTFTTFKLKVKLEM
jgi:hypothetical protein